MRRRVIYPMLNAYRILGLTRGATEAQVRKAYRSRAKRWHPDVCRRPDATERFRDLTEAQSILLNPQKRKKLDASIRVDELRAKVAQQARPQINAASPAPGTFTQRAIAVAKGGGLLEGLGIVMLGIMADDVLKGE